MKLNESIKRAIKAKTLNEAQQITDDELQNILNSFYDNLGADFNVDEQYLYKGDAAHDLNTKGKAKIAFIESKLSDMGYVDIVMHKNNSGIKLVVSFKVDESDTAAIGVLVAEGKDNIKKMINKISSIESSIIKPWISSFDNLSNSISSSEFGH